MRQRGIDVLVLCTAAVTWNVWLAFWCIWSICAELYASGRAEACVVRDHSVNVMAVRDIARDSRS
jgi:hypothetical protein